MVIQKSKKSKIIKPKIEKRQEPAKKRYFEAVGRRKTAVARARLASDSRSEIIVNDKPCETYFFTPELAKIAMASLRKMKLLSKFYITAKIKGGGIHSQAEAFRHATARVLVKFNPDFRKKLKKAGYLTRDPRVKERRKFGLKKARKAPQWRKR